MDAPELYSRYTCFKNQANQDHQESLKHENFLFYLRENNCEKLQADDTTESEFANYTDICTHMSAK